MAQLLFILIYTTPFASAQHANTTPPPTDPLSSTTSFNPSLVILMVIIVSAFFALGFFSYYIRQCIEMRYGFSPSASASPVGGRRDRWWSLRRHQGLQPEVIDTFPTFPYSVVKGHKLGQESLECAVCLNEFDDDQTLRLIPKCSHVFHPPCIDSWLASHTTCPLCRANLVPKPGDLAFDSVSIFEPNNNNNSVEPRQVQDRLDEETRTDVLIHVQDDNDRNRSELPTQQSPDFVLLSSANQNMPPRSWSTGWLFGRLFPRSPSTGPVENMDRFTLRLPQEIRSQLMNTHLNRTKSCVAFLRASSPKNGYRSKSGKSWRNRSFFYNERFDREGQPERSGLTSILPFMSRTGSVQISKGDNSSPDLNADATPPKIYMRTRSVKAPFDRLLLGVDKNNSKNDIGERSSDWLRPDVSHSQI